MHEKNMKEGIKRHLVPSADVGEVARIIALSKEDFKCEYVGLDLYKVHALDGTIIASKNATPVVPKPIPDKTVTAAKNMGIDTANAMSQGSFPIYMGGGRALPPPEMHRRIKAKPPYVATDFLKYMEALKQGVVIQVHAVLAQQSQGLCTAELNKLDDKGREIMAGVPILMEVPPHVLSHYRTYTHLASLAVPLLAVIAAVISDAHYNCGIHDFTWGDYLNDLQESLPPTHYDVLDQTYRHRQGEK